MWTSRHGGERTTVSAAGAWLVAGALALSMGVPLVAQTTGDAPPPPSTPGVDAEAAAASELTPILLVPGWSDGAATMGPLEVLLREAGWPDSRVARVEFEDPVGSNRDHADELAAALYRLRERTGAVRVDVVAHSMGGLATRYFLQNGGGEAVRRVVFVATPHRGTWTAYLAWGEGGREMQPGSLFLMDLQAFRAVPSGVEAITLRTKVDFHVLPPESATLVGIPDIEVCCPSHEGLLSHPDAFQAIRRFLTRGEAPKSLGPGGMGDSGETAGPGGGP
jgi:triacylglycerol lipase